jgi:tRNA modification GTPase
VSLRGLPVVLVDTAGITETLDPVESIGVDRSRQALEQADLALVVYDAAAGWTAEDDAIFEGLAGGRTLVAANKRDLLPAGASASSSPEAAIPISALTGEGLQDLEDAIYRLLLPNSAGDDIMVNNLRHKTLLEEAAAHVDEAIRSVQQGRAADFVCIDLRASLSALGTITGTEVSESLLDEIFSRFCIGK